MLITLLILSCFSLSPPSTADWLHEFHLSKCEIDYNTGENALQISMHIFIDDLETALAREGKEKLYICTEKEAEKAEMYLVDYLTRHFQLQVNGQPVTYNFIGKEVSEDLQAVWCYLEVESVNQINRLSVINNILMETFDDQKNIVSIKGPNKKQGYFLMMNGKYEDEITF